MKTLKHLFSSSALLFVVATVTNNTQAQFSPPTAGLIAWWRGEGNADDSSGNGHSGTLLSRAGFENGRFGQAFSFGGNLNRILVPDANDFKLTNSLSISAWVFP